VKDFGGALLQKNLLLGFQQLPLEKACKNAENPVNQREGKYI